MRRWWGWTEQDTKYDMQQVNLKRFITISHTGLLLLLVSRGILVFFSSPSYLWKTFRIFLLSLIWEMTWRIFHVFYFPTRKPIFSICLLVLFIIKFPRWCTCVLFSKNIHFTLSAFLRFYCLQTNLLQRDSTLNFSSASLFFLSSYLPRNFNFISQKILFENRTQIQKKVGVVISRTRWKEIFAPFNIFSMR